MAILPSLGDDVPMKERTPLILGGAVIGVLLLIALVAGLGRDVTSLDATTPEGTVQQYLQALLQDDRFKADALVSEDSEDRCLGDEVDWVLDDARVALGAVEVEGSHATVEVVTTEISEGALGGPRYDSAFDLMLIDGDWRIAAADWPYGCGRSSLEERES